MDCVLPQIHSYFDNLGFANGKYYHVYENCNASLETILRNILTEDKYLRTFRRTIYWGDIVKRDFIPLLIHAKEDRTIELLVKIFVNLTIPVECLLCVSLISQTGVGVHVLYEIKNLLTSTKAAFTDPLITKIFINFLKRNIHNVKKVTLSMQQRINVGNCLLLLNNILQIPEDNSGPSLSYKGSNHPFQNQIIWNIFSQTIDKILITLLVSSEASNWGVTMVQLIATLYKDQNVVELYNFLNLWLKTQLESSEDDESSTSSRSRGTHKAFDMLTCNPASSDTEGSRVVGNEWNLTASETPSVNKTYNEEKRNPVYNTNENQKSEKQKQPDKEKNKSKLNVQGQGNKKGFGNLIQNQEPLSTSSDEDEMSKKKPVHDKQKQRFKKKTRPEVPLQFCKQKKVVKRRTVNVVNIRGLSRKTPTDGDISNIMKEFTVDFLFNGYNSLVQTLHTQISTNKQLVIDPSHFIWPISYFLQFAMQIELDFEKVSRILSYDVVSYLTADGVNLCEQVQSAAKRDVEDLQQFTGRLHLVVTAIRGVILSIEAYKGKVNMSKKDQETLLKLQIKMCETEEFRSLPLLLLRHYNSKYHSKQYLQDLITTNHFLMLFLDSAMKLPDYSGPNRMLDLMKQFATRDVMFLYGLLLEDYAHNDKFVNDCIFTMLHHVAGDWGCLATLMQSKIISTFTSIQQSNFEICDDWCDLIEYVVNSFIKKPQTSKFTLDPENFEDDKVFDKPVTPTKLPKQTVNVDNKNSGPPSTLEHSECETTSVASGLSEMFVSDEDEAN